MHFTEENVKYYIGNSKTYGRGSPKNLWSRQEHQSRRFSKFIEIFDFNNKDILDIGCGYGDFYHWLVSRGIHPRSYVGIDLVSEHCDVARENLPGECVIIDGDFLEKEIPKCDISILSGTLNVYGEGWLEIAHKILDKMWELSTQGMAFNIRSPHGLDGEHEEKAKQIKDICPQYWCGYAHGKTCRYALYHNYMHYDYTVALWKAELGWQEKSEQL